jgi:hypothetical protein
MKTAKTKNQGISEFLTGRCAGEVAEKPGQKSKKKSPLVSACQGKSVFCDF